ncbi:hypothetical protein J4211_01330 [Candidatus Woesearchaeota archaeon]|nr:hypothetical protein [uncultured archaeon]AQS33848.1 hypothetical protein [uncultured archaeon]MBS3124878.1 hypothetical protein [Candidatus Woesearchaeota archaeon]
MHKILFTIIIALLALPFALAQIPWEVSDQRCHNKVLDQFELCERYANETRCDALGEILEVDTACDTAHCTCLPRVNKAFCGNNQREGIEVCDGTGDDKCAEYGQRVNMTLVCNPKTCGCSINEKLPADYNPVAIETLANSTQKITVCGDKKVERDEDCDPPNTLCTTYRKEAGVCTQKCKCLPPDMLDKEDEITAPFNVSTTNETNTTLTNTSELLTPPESENNTTQELSEEPPEQGFFARFISWLAGLFS